MKVLEKSYTFEILAPEHKPDIIRIFNYYVENSFAAYSTVVLGDEVFDRFHDMAEVLPFIVISYNKSEIVGFAFLHPYHAADAFSKTAEITYFIMKMHVCMPNSVIRSWH